MDKGAKDIIFLFIIAIIAGLIWLTGIIIINFTDIEYITLPSINLGK